MAHEAACLTGHLHVSPVLPSLAKAKCSSAVNEGAFSAVQTWHVPYLVKLHCLNYVNLLLT